MSLPNLSNFLQGAVGNVGGAGQGNSLLNINKPYTPPASTDPSKVAASTTVASPATTAAQSNSISKGAGSGSLVNQLYNLPTGGQSTQKGGTGTAATGGYAGNPASNPNYTAPTTSTTPTGYGDQTTPGSTVSTSNISTLAGGTQGVTPTSSNALLNDPELAGLNTDIQNTANQEAAIQGAQNAFVTDETGNAITSPTTGDFLSNDIGANSFNSMKTAQEEGNLGLAMTAEQAAFANREGQVKDAYTQTPVAPGGVNVNPYTNEPVASNSQVAQFGQGEYTPPVATPENPTGGEGAAGGAGTSSDGSVIDPSNPLYPALQQYAQMAANGQISGIPSSITGNPVLNAQLNTMAKAINPNYNPVTSAAESAATASNVETAGTAGTNAASTGYASTLQKYNDNVASYTALTGISNQVTSTLANYAQTGSLTDANAAINTLQGHLSNPDYQKFITAIGNAQASYQAILGGSGVTPTKADQDALNALNPNSSASTIIAALNQLSSDAHALIVAPTYQELQTYGSDLGIQ